MVAPGAKFFLEVFSGRGRLADKIREMFHDVVAIEIDIVDKGGRRDLIKKEIYREVMELARHPDCLGVWFGFPCGTFSAARRYDGGPPPLRGHAGKSIWGLDTLTGTDRVRVNKANALLRRMHEMMRELMRYGRPFYLENPLRSKLWCHPYIKKWVRHDLTTTVILDYCQFGEAWVKPTQILAFNNAGFNGKLARRCKTTWEGKTSVCSRTKRAHVPLIGFVGDKTRGQYRTAAACPYPFEFCEHVAPTLVKQVFRRQPRLRP